jgi:hypothetical protein
MTMRRTEKQAKVGGRRCIFQSIHNRARNALIPRFHIATLCIFGMMEDFYDRNGPGD